MKSRSNGNGRIQKIPTQNHQKKTTTIFLVYKQSEWNRKANDLNGEICGTKSRGRQRTKYTDSANNFLNNELTRRTDDREDWTAMIADVCNRPGTV